LVVNLTIELDREADGRRIAEVPELNILLYGDSQPNAIQRASSTPNPSRSNRTSQVAS